MGFAMPVPSTWSGALILLVVVIVVVVVMVVMVVVVVITLYQCIRTTTGLAYLYRAERGLLRTYRIVL